ncbi:MAG: mraZ [Verrucomicrobia bacterium]|nr:mraZ [Verrucomicrobiota bacterium]
MLQTVRFTWGEFEHTLDARRRVTVPSAWRVEGDEGNFYLAWPHPEGCIALFPPEMQRELVEKARSIRQSDKAGQATLRMIFGKSHSLGCDKQGRILLPEPLLKHADIDRNAWMVGLGRNFQIWSPTRYKPEGGDDFDILEAMERLGF